MFKIVIGRIDVKGKDCPAVAVFLNNIPVSHADVAKMFSIYTTHAGFATHADGTAFINVYGRSISLNKSTETVDKVLLNNTLKHYSFIQIPYHAFASRFHVWLCIPPEHVESLVCTYDNNAVFDFDQFVNASQKHFEQFFN